MNALAALSRPYRVSVSAHRRVADRVVLTVTGIPMVIKGASPEGMPGGIDALHVAWWRPDDTHLPLEGPMFTRSVLLTAALALFALPNAVSAHCSSCGAGGDDHEKHDEAPRPVRCQSQTAPRSCLWHPPMGPPSKAP